MKSPVTVLDLGLASYDTVWELQKRMHSELLNGSGKERLLLVEHPAVVTLGRGAKESNLKRSVDEIKASGIEVFHIERGGDVTYHGPGQLVAYPILNLNQHKRDVGWYMRSLEEVVIRTLSDYSVQAIRIPGRTGVWIQNTTEAPGEHACQSLTSSKICSIGVRLSRWCTYHGLSVNVLPATEGFEHIHPCGCPGVVVTSLEQELQNRNTESNTSSEVSANLMGKVKHRLVRNFSAVFECEATIVVAESFGRY
jgi:lipoyl(octanoyl) transferase